MPNPTPKPSHDTADAPAGAGLTLIVWRSDLLDQISVRQPDPGSVQALRPSRASSDHHGHLRLLSKAEQPADPHLVEPADRAGVVAVGGEGEHERHGCE